MRSSRAAVWTFLALALVCAGVFISLGVWQLSRLAETREANRLVETRMEQAAVDLDLNADEARVAADSLAWRRVRARGTWDFDREIVIRGRAMHGTPGVHVVTPLVLGSGEALLVLRGWLPAADGLSADLTGSRPYTEGSEVDVVGLALAGETASRIPGRTHSFDSVEHRVLGSLDLEAAEAALPYPVLPVYVLLSESRAVDGGPAIVDEPAPSDGPHLWYAVQWFAFALITIGGFLAFARTQWGSPLERSTS